MMMSSLGWHTYKNQWNRTGQDPVFPPYTFSHKVVVMQNENNGLIINQLTECCFRSVRTLSEGKVMTDYNTSEQLQTPNPWNKWEQTARIQTVTGETRVFSGREEHQYHEGVSIILKKAIERAQLEWTWQTDKNKTEIHQHYCNTVNCSNQW